MIIFHPMMFILAQYRPMSLVTLFTTTVRRTLALPSLLFTLLSNEQLNNIVTLYTKLVMSGTVSRYI